MPDCQRLRAGRRFSANDGSIGCFCAGEPTSIGGVELSLVEGQIAGLAAAGRAPEARALFGKREKARRFAKLLDRTFRLRSGTEQPALVRNYGLPLRRRSRIRGFASTVHGAPPNCIRAAAWDHVRDESAARQRNFFSTGIRIRFGRQFFPLASKPWPALQYSLEPSPAK